MSTKSNKPRQKLPRWNLKDLFKNEAELEKSAKAMGTAAKAFEKKYKGKLAGLSESMIND